MSSIARQPRRIPDGLIGSISWGLLAAVHAAPLWKTSATLVIEGPTPARVGAWVAVTLSFLLFALQAAGFNLLRVRLRRATLAVVAVCFAIVHGDTTVSAVKSDPGAALTIAVVAETAVIVAPRVRRAFPEFLARLRDAGECRLPPHERLGYLPCAGALRARSIDGIGRATARGPPA